MEYVPRYHGAQEYLGGIPVAPMSRSQLMANPSNLLSPGVEWGVDGWWGWLVGGTGTGVKTAAPIYHPT